MMRVLLFSPVRGETSCVKFRQNAETVGNSYNALVPASNTARLKKNGRHWSPGEGGFVVFWNSGKRKNRRKILRERKRERRKERKKDRKKRRRTEDTCNRDFDCTSLQMSIVSFVVDIFTTNASEKEI